MTLVSGKSLFPLMLLSLSLSSHTLANPAPASVPSSTLQAFKQSWLGTALKLQREIDMNTPLKEATFIGTHNSYNSKAYQIPFVRYIDPNHTLSIYDQLEAGIRSIEMDAHWTLSNNFSRDILLCHGLSNHVGCGMFDRHFTEGLQELHDWLKNNPDEVVMLYIERHLDGHEPRLAAMLDQYLGDYIYKPSLVRKNGENSKSCVSVPTSISKADVLKAGKQLIVFVEGCDGTKPAYEEQDKYPQVWNDYVFAGIGDVPSNPYGWFEEVIRNFSGYPDCSKSTIFKNDTRHESLWRIFEDRTILSGVIHPGKNLEANDMHELIRCGINWPTMDLLTLDDPRLSAAIWSWAPEYPQENHGMCTIYKFGTGIQNVSCNQTVAGFACQNENTHEFKAISTAGTWMSGEPQCQAAAGKEWHFAVPVNGAQMETLKNSMTPTSIQEVWLNYAANDKGKWVANNRDPQVKH